MMSEDFYIYIHFVLHLLLNILKCYSIIVYEMFHNLRIIFQCQRFTVIENNEFVLKYLFLLNNNDEYEQ